MNASRTGTVAVPDSTAAGRETTFKPTGGAADRRCRQAGSCADLDSRRVGERYGRHDLEPTRIDDAQHRVAGRRLDKIAGVVQTRRR